MKRKFNSLGLILTAMLISISTYCQNVEQFTKFELDIDPSSLSSSDEALVNSKNPFNKEDIILRVTFTPPVGDDIQVNGFYYEEFNIVEDTDPSHRRSDWPHLNPEDVVTTSNENWKVRFTPEQIGSYTYSIEYFLPVENRTISVSSGSFTSTANSDPKAGFIRLVNEDYFAYPDGSGFIPIGINLYHYPMWGDHQPKVNFYNLYFEELSNHGCNMIHMTCDFKSAALGLVGIDTRCPTTYLLDSFSMSDAYVLDEIVEAAESHGIKIQLRLFSHENFTETIKCGSREYNYSWHDYNAWNINSRLTSPDPSDPCIRTPYCEQNTNGIITNKVEFFTTTNTDVMTQQNNLIQYIIDRWGYSTAILAWEIFAEADNPLNSSDWNVLTTWHSEKATLIKNADIYDRAVSTSFTQAGADNFNSSPFRNIFQNQNIDFVQLHRYYNQFNFPGVVAEKHLFDNYLSIQKSYFGKPILISESGSFQGDTYYESLDPHGYAYHEFLWANIFGGVFGTYLDWTWYAFIDRLSPTMAPTDYMKHLQALSKYLDNIDVLGKQNQYSYRINSSVTDNLNIYYVKDTEAQKFYGWVQDENFVINNLISNPASHIMDPYIANLDESLKPERASQSNTFTLTSVPNGQYVITWYDTEDGNLVKEESATINNSTIELKIPSELIDSKFGDAAFILTKSTYGWKESLLVSSSTNTVLPYTDLKIGNGQLFYIRELDSKIHTMYIPTYSGDVWSDDWVHSSASLKYGSSTCLGYDVVPENQNEIFYANAYGGNINRLYWSNNAYILTSTASGYENVSLNSELNFGNNQIFYASSDGTLHMLYQYNGSWRYDWLNSSAPKLKSGTGFVVIPELNNTIYYIGTDSYIYKMYWTPSGWVKENTSTNYYSRARSDSKMRYGNNQIFYVQYSGKLQVLYKKNGSWTFDWINEHAPNVKAGTGFDLIPEENNTIYYIGEDNNIYKCYWTYTDNWVWEQFNIKNSSSGGAKSNSNVVYQDDQIFYVGANDGKVHRLQHINSVPFSATSTTVNKGNNWDLNYTDGADVAYKFYIPATTTISATTSHSETTIASSKIQIFNNSFNSVAYKYIGSPSSGVSLNTTLSPGYYYIVVDGYDVGNFKLTVDIGGLKSAFIEEDEISFNENINVNNTETINDEIIIYPNPVKDKMNIELRSNENSEFLFELFDIKGQLLISEKSIGNILSVECSRLQKGIYIAKTTTSSGTYSSKIVLSE